MAIITKSRIKYILILILAVLLSFWLGRLSRPSATTVDITQKWPSEIRTAMLSLEPWLQNAQAVGLGKYIIFTPKESNTSKLKIVTNPPRKYVDIDENQISAITLDNKVNDSILISDKDKDSGRRSISYDIYDDKDNIIGNVIDIGRDGQPDFKYMRGDGKEMLVKQKDKYLWVAGQWRLWSIKEKARAVLIDGKWRRVKFVQSHFELE